jgi:glycosyltransferase involved in cell wall biosynthesis
MKLRYVFRKRLAPYNSIEELFHSIISQVAQTAATTRHELTYSGASPKTLYKNCSGFKKEKDSIVHITGDVHYIALCTGRQTILTIHDIGSALKGSVFKRFYINLLWFWLPALFVKRITVISEFTKQQLSQKIPFAKHKIRVIYNPANPLLTYSPKPFAAQRPTLLFVGTKPNKNLERSLKAIEGLSCKALIIGPLSEVQTTLLERLNIDYEHKENLSFPEVVACYKRCDLLCFASLYEGFGMPIIEAQASGRPVITSNIGAMKEIAEGSALLVDPYDVQAIREGILKIIEQHTLRTELIDAGLKNVTRFQLDNITKNYMELYNEVMAS